MILAGSEKLQRYPSIPNGKRGIPVYDKKNVRGVMVYKIAASECERATGLGYGIAHIGRSYIYVTTLREFMY